MKNIVERITRIEKELKELKKDMKSSGFKGLTIGDTFTPLDMEWKIIDRTEAGFMCLADRLKEKIQFDAHCNNWDFSDLRNYLNTGFYKKLEDEIGAENIIEFERDLLSLDGQTEYGKCMDKVSIISFDEYRSHRNLIPNTDYFWWTLTPSSTKCNGDTKWVRVVSSSGDVISHNYDNVYGVRPFCIFASELFESDDTKDDEEEEDDWL